MKFFSAILLLAASVAVSGQEKIPVDIYSEALCPYCRQIIDDLVKVVKEDGILTAMDFDFVPYGNARNHSGQISCQHGPKECFGNLVEACVKAQTNRDPLKYMPFVQCLERETSMSDSDVQRCARQTGLDYNTITTCVQGQQGTDLINMEGAKTEKAHIPGTPTIKCNGRQINGPEEITRCVCNNFTGRKPPACSRMCLRDW